MKTLAMLMPIAAMQTKARAFASSITGRWDVPQHSADTPVPEDLRDASGWMNLTADGQRISSLVLTDDLMDQEESHPVVPLLLATLPILAAVGMIHGWLMLTALILAILVGFLVMLAGVKPARVAGLWCLGFLLPSIGAAMASSMAANGSSIDWLKALAANPIVVVNTLKFLAPTVAMVIGLVVGLAYVFSGFKAHVAAATAKTMGLLALLFGVSSLLPGPLRAFAYFALGCTAPLIYIRLINRDRSLLLAAQGTRFGGEGSGRLSYAHINARAGQVKNALKDQTPLIRLGTATGTFSGLYDPFSPDQGLPVVVSGADLATHLLALGTTQTGKTVMLRNVLCQWIAKACGGAVILDGKGSLASEFRELPGYLLIEPQIVDGAGSVVQAGVSLGLIEGLEPGRVSEAIYNVVFSAEKSGSGNAKFFMDSALILGRHAEQLLHQLARTTAKQGEPVEKRWSWTLADLDLLSDRLVSMMPEAKWRSVTATRLSAGDDAGDPSGIGNDFRFWIDYLRAHSPEVGRGGLLDAAIHYAEITMQGMDEDTRANIHATFKSWTSPMLSNASLLPWCKSEKGVDISAPLKGGVMGINLPQVKFGIAGAMVQGLIRQRLFSAIRMRADRPNWREDGSTSVMFMVDEAQEIVGTSDRELLAIARSLGAVMVYASQSADAFVAKMGRDQAAEFFPNFRSMVVLRSSPASYALIRDVLGHVQRPTWKNIGGAINWNATAKQVLGSPLFDAKHPLRPHLKKLLRQGAGRPTLFSKGDTLDSRADDLKLADSFLHSQTISGGTFEFKPLLDEAEFSSRTAEQGVAVVQIMRGGVMRRDIVKLDNLTAVPNSLLATVT